LSGQKDGSLFRLAVAGALWLGLFSFLFTLGAQLKTWPELPAGSLRGMDLAAGLAAGAAILLVLVKSLASRNR